MSDHLQEWARWMRVGPKVERNLVIDAEGLNLVRYKVAPGHTVPMHAHDVPQITVMLSGTGIHRFTVAVQSGRRSRRVTTVLPVGPGDCYYIPPGTPHSFSSDAGGPVVCIDIMVHRNSVPAAARSSLRSTARARRRRGSR